MTCEKMILSNRPHNPNFQYNVQLFKHVTIGLFEAKKTIGQALVRTLTVEQVWLKEKYHYLCQR